MTTPPPPTPTPTLKTSTQEPILLSTLPSVDCMVWQISYNRRNIRHSRTRATATQEKKDEDKNIYSFGLCGGFASGS